MLSNFDCDDGIDGFDDGLGIILETPRNIGV